MVRGSFKIWESVIAVIGGAATVIIAIVCTAKGVDETPRQSLFGFVFAALALFVRPIWLIVNWECMYEKEHSAMVTDVFVENYGGRNGYYKFTKLTYGKKKKRKTITVANVMFFSPKLGKTYRLVFSSRRPEEFLILPAARINAVVFAILGIVLEIFLAALIF